MARRFALVTTLLAWALLSTGPVAAGAPVPSATAIEADLEGVPIPAAAISKYYCDDFDFPRIHCFTSPVELDASLSVELSLSLL